MTRTIGGSGDYWQKQLQDLADKKEHMQRSTMCYSTPAARAEMAIRMLQQRIADAQGEERAEVCVYGWIMPYDLNFSLGLAEEIIAHSGDILTKDQLTGAARVVFEACEVEGLECFIAREPLPTKEPQYNLHARPKRSAQ